MEKCRSCIALKCTCVYSGNQLLGSIVKDDVGKDEGLKS